MRIRQFPAILRIAMARTLVILTRFRKGAAMAREYAGRGQCKRCSNEITASEELHGFLLIGFTIQQSGRISCHFRNAGPHVAAQTWPIKAFEKEFQEFVTGLTLGGHIAGTAASMWAEQACGKSLDSRTDIWSFGCVLYEMFSGKQPFQGSTLTE